MVLWIIRAVFLALLAGLPFLVLSKIEGYQNPSSQLGTVALIVLFGAAVVAGEFLTPRKSLAGISGLFFGLIVGVLFAYISSLIIDSVAQSITGRAPSETALLPLIKLVAAIVCGYVCTALVLKTKDDFRFVIPYVEFAKQTKGPKTLLLDTSVIIDGRIADICETRIIDSPLVIPRFVLAELQAVADSPDKLKRNRGRRGLDVLNRLQSNEKLELRIHQEDPENGSPAATGGPPGREDVDQRLVTLAKELNGRIMTNDYNLNKVAQFRGVEVININDLANALKPVVLPGETMTVKILKPGEEPGQGVGYLEDGTMVVAANSRDKIGAEVVIEVTSVLQTSAGRMIFGRPEGEKDTLSGRQRIRRP
jgi:uncharacterized protein YacL